MYIKPIYIKILCVAILILGIVMGQYASHGDQDAATKSFLSKAAFVLYILAFGLYFYFGSILGETE